MKVSAKELIKINVIDEIIKEPSGGAHRDYAAAAANIKSSLIDNLQKIGTIEINDLLERRYQRLITIGK